MPKALQESLINNVDDSAPMDAVTVNAFSTFSKLFPSAGYDPSNIEDTVKNSKQNSEKEDTTGLEYAWSGIIGVVSAPPQRLVNQFTVAFACRRQIPCRSSVRFPAKKDSTLGRDSMGTVCERLRKGYRYIAYLRASVPVLFCRLWPLGMVCRDPLEM